MPTALIWPDSGHVPLSYNRGVEYISSSDQTDLNYTRDWAYAGIINGVGFTPVGDALNPEAR